MTDTVSIPKSEFKAMQDQLALLMKAASPRKLAKHTKIEDKGKKVKISVFREDAKSDPKVVTGWKLIEDVVFTDKTGIKETQIIEIYYDDVTSAGSQLGYKAQLSRCEKALVDEKDADKIKELNDKIKDYEQKINEVGKGKKTMSYVDFTKSFIIKESVDVISTTEKNGELFYEVEFNGKTYTLAQPFIN